MTPERWRQVLEVFDAALQREQSERSAFVESVCVDDDDLARAVHSLLLAHQSASGFASAPIMSAQSALVVGEVFGPYRIDALLGRGGMGEVYKARDTTLNREVALKILPISVSLDADRVARFKREAQLLASVNHPNIATIHGIEENDGLCAIVMEVVEGETLAQRIARGPLPLDDVLAVALQIADALAAAHHKNVVHRDLKPANIVTTPDGRVKVLDFGLAKSGGVSGAASEQTIVATTPGVVVGTTAYMSPEQTRGLPTDQRTDVWAFGCVVYEMLCGRSPFAGETVLDTIAGILEREPDWRALPRSTPRPIRELLGRCLRKDPEHRLRNIVPGRLEIDEARSRLRGRRAIIEWPRMAAGIALAMIIVAAMWWQPWKSGSLIQRETASTRQSTLISTHEPVTIVIADFRNRTGDPAFDRTLDLTFRRALEEAGFISAFDRSRTTTTLGVPSLSYLGDAAARALAVRQGLSLVLYGSIEYRGSVYEISVTAVQAVTAQEVTSARSRASRKEQVLEVVTQLAIEIRRALGDTTPPRDQLSALRTVSAGSLEVVGHHAAALDSQSKGRYEETRRHLLKALELDPKFGPGYQALAVLSRILGEREAANSYLREALQNLDAMTERERFSTRGFYYRLASDHQQCAKVFGEMTARYTADAIAHNQRALCLSLSRDMRGAVDAMRRAVQILPKQRILRGNLAIYANYAGDFQTAAREARAIEESPDLAILALAFAQIGQGDVQAATETYHKLASAGTRGASWSASGLADVALHEGRFSEAVRLLEQGAAQDLAAKSPERAARKFAALAYAQLWRGQKNLATTAAENALVNGQTGAIRFLAARVFVQAGALGWARTEAARISLGTFVDKGPSEAAGGPTAEPEAYAKIIEAEIALANEDPRQAIKLLVEANTLADTWLGHFDLGLAYLKVSLFPQADLEFTLCLQRRGEAMALFFDEEPTYGFFPPVFYYQGIAREGMNSAESAADSFRTYVSIRGKSNEDALLVDVRRRARP